jgi:hypothetical protein
MILFPSPFRVFSEQARRVVEALAVESQLGSRRNAMIASTALAQRRAELSEVEEFFAELGVTPEHPGTDRTGREAAATAVRL